MCSGRILIGRSLIHAQHDTRRWPRSRYLVVRARRAGPVATAKRSHPFPCRTRKLSSSALMIAGGSPPVKVDRCRAFFIIFRSSSVVEQSAVNRLVAGSNPACGATGELSEWPKEHDWKSCRRHSRLEGSNPSLSAIHIYFRGPLVKWLRHRPFTAVTRVRIPYGSPFTED